MSTKAKLGIVLVVAAVVAVVVWAVSTVPQAPPPSEAPASKTMSYDGNTIREEKDGRVIWELTADHIEIDTDTKNVTIEGVHGKFYAADGRIAEVTADHGSYDATSRDVTLEGGIAITNSDGASLQSDQLKWTAAEQCLSALGNALAQKDDITISGDRIDSTDAFNKVKVSGHAHIAKGDTSNETR